jgi:hypothetical protein
MNHLSVAGYARQYYYHARKRYDFCLKKESKKDRRKPGKRRDSARLDKGPLHRALVVCITTEN